MKNGAARGDVDRAAAGLALDPALWPATTCCRGQLDRPPADRCRSGRHRGVTRPPAPLLDYVASLRATAAADDGERVLPGHGEPFSGAAELIATRIAMTGRRAEKILAALTHERTAADLGRALRRHVPVTQAYLVLSEALGRLDLLEQPGRVTQREADGVVLFRAS